MKTKLFFLAFLTSLLSWGQATLPVSRTSNWNTATVTGWTHTGTTNRTSAFACSGGNAETFDTTGDRIVLFVNAAPNQLIFKLKSASMSGASSLLVEKSNDGSTYTTLGNYGTASGATTITDCADITLSLNNATRYIRWTYTRSSGSVDIDDVSVSASAGPAPILAITPATTNLGTSCVGTPTTAVTYTITNSGTVDATGVTVMSSGTHNTNFVVSGFTAGSTITAGNSATYTVTFTPSAIGTRNATITVASTTSGSNSPTTALTGTGTAVVAPVVNTSTGATAILDVSATLNGNVTNLGTCPAVITKGFVYSQTAVNATPTNGGTGVTTTPGVAVGGTGTYNVNITGLTPNTNYSYRSYVFDGTTYTYSSATITFTTRGVPVVSNGAFSGNAGAAITTFNLSTLATNSPFTGFAITGGALPAGLSLNTTTGAITGTPTATGTFIINFSATNVIGTSATSGIVTITINPTQNSDIVAVAGSSPATISSTINTATISTVTDGVQVWSFTIRDGGASSDADGLPTTLTALTITQGGANSISNWTHAIQSVALFDGSTFVANGTINANNIVFSGISVVAPDNGSKTLTMRLSLTCPLGATAVDGNDFDFSITQANITFLATGSGKNTGAPVASTPDNTVNFIQVVATSLSFTTQPSSTGVTVAMPNVVVTATDACGNRDVNFTGVVTLNSTGTITGAPLTVNAVAGVATFTNIIHSVIGTNYQMTASVVGLTNGLSSYYDIFAITQLQRGDLAIIAVNTDIGSGTDQIAFVCFEDILPGTTIFLTDNGYERQFAGLWGGTEGLITITRTGSVLPKGTIVVFESTTANVTSPSHYDIYTCGSLDTNWTKTALSGGSIGGFNLNSDDDIWIMQGGTWINDIGHQSTYNGNVLYGWSESGWNTAPGGASQDTKWSTVIDGLECYTTNVVGNAKVKFNDPINPDFSTLTNGRFDWIALINNSANWDTYATNAAYNTGGYDYKGSTTCPALVVAGNTYVNGKWTGKQDTNWFNCGNWDTLVVPDETVDVQVGDNSFDRQAIVNASAPFAAYYGNIAKAKNLIISGEKVEVTSNVANILEVHGNLQISGTGVLDMDDSNAGTADGQLYLHGNWTNNIGNAAFEEGNGTVHFTGTTPQIINNVTPLGTEVFYNVVLNNNFTTAVSNDLIASGNLTVNTGKIVEVSPDDYIQVNENLINNGSFTVFNNGSLIQVNDSGVNTGNISYQRIASVKLQDYVYWSSPVSGFDVNSISPATPAYYHWEWNPTIANPNGGEGNWVNASTTMLGGKGYIVRAPNGFSNSANQNWTATFNNGVPNNGVYTPTIARGTDLNAGTAGPNGVMRTVTDDNWNLLGNPYPSAISINAFLLANTQLDGFVRLWTHGNLPTYSTDPFYNNFVYNYTAGDYIALNGSGATSGPSAPGVIGAGQGFFVLMDPGAATTSTALFNNAMRSKNYSNSHFYRNANSQNVGPEANVERHRIWLDLVSPTNETTRTLVAYVEGATAEKDRMFDALTDYKSAQNFYSLIADQVMTIQGKGLPFEQEDRVPLGLKIPSNGIYKIAIATVDGLFSGNQNIYLEDKSLGVIHDLRQNPYSFTGTSGILNDRFVLRYTNETLGNEDFENNSDVLIFSSDVISVNAMSRTIQNVKIYNVLGQLLLDSDAVNSDTFETSKLQKNNTTLLVQVTLENGIKVTKKIVF